MRTNAKRCSLRIRSSPIYTPEPPTPPPGLWDVPGEEQLEVDGRLVKRGDKVVLRLGDRIDTYDRILDGRTATIERIFVDFDERVYFGVTIDGEAGQELLRETSRFLFFFLDEVEVLPS